MTAPHLDDEQLSDLLDAGGPDGRAEAPVPRDDHLERCERCRSRFDAFSSGRSAVASAVVPPLPAGVVDDLVARALAAAEQGGGEAGVHPITAPTRRARRMTAPPPAWLLGAVAAIAVLAGVAGVVQRPDDTSAAKQLARTGDRGGVVAADSEVATGGRTAAPADLGDLDDPAALVALLSAGSANAGGAALVPAEEGFEAGPSGALRNDADDLRSGESATAGASPPPAPAADSAAPAAQCRAEAERIGAGRLGAALSTSLVRWKGQPAEVLVFALTEPANGVSRQALVLARPGCALLADPRF